MSKVGYNGKKNYLTGNILSDEWYTPMNVVTFIKDIAPKDKTIICPFDTDASNFVHVFPNSIHNIRDFMETEYDYDICITNPPFSNKFDILERIVSHKKDAILVFPETAIFSVSFFKLIQKYKFCYKIYVPKTRIYFINQNGDQNRPNFHSIILYISSRFTENTIEHVDLDGYGDV